MLIITYRNPHHRKSELKFVFPVTVLQVLDKNKKYKMGQSYKSKLISKLAFCLINSKVPVNVNF